MSLVIRLGRLMDIRKWASRGILLENQRSSSIDRLSVTMKRSPWARWCSRLRGECQPCLEPAVSSTASLRLGLAWLKHKHRINHISTHISHHLQEHIVTLVLVFNKRILLSITPQTHGLAQSIHRLKVFAKSINLPADEETLSLRISRTLLFDLSSLRS